MKKVKYTHPLKYKGVSENPHIQYRMKQKVEAICLKCDKFMGKEHDFLECDLRLYRSDHCPKNIPVIFWDKNELIYESEELTNE